MNFFEKMIEIAKSMGVKDFAYYKKWALDHLKKQLDEDKTVAKAIEWCEEYMEKAYGVGTIRTWKGKKYIKGPDKKWRRYYDKKSRGTSQAIAYIMKEISSLENGDVEGLYNIIQKNAGRFRDENGNVLPEVQQIHDLVEKKQSGTTEKNSRVEEKKDVSKMSREEIISEMAKQVKLKTNRDENYYNELRNELDKYNQAVENARNESGNKINVDDFQLSKIGKKIDGEYPRFNNEQQKRLFSRIVDQYGETDKARTLLSKLVDFNSQKNESLEINPYGDSWDYMKKQAAYEPKESEINTKIENYLKEEKQKKDKELNISDSDINSLTDIDYLKDLQKKVVKENNRLHAEKKYDESNDMARRNYVISDRIKQLESEQEKHDNRSNAMTGNQNAKKEENTGYTITNKNGVKLTRENALKRINGSLDTARASLKTYEESIKNSDISMKVAAETQINMSLNHAKDLIGRLKPEDKKELETELKKLSDELEDLRKYNTNKVKESEMRNQDQKSQYNKMLEQFKSEVSDETKEFLGTTAESTDPKLEEETKQIDNGGIKKSFLEQIEEISKSMNKAEPKHDLEYYKKWALSILDKQKEEPEEEDEPNEETIVKALAYTEMIAKAGYPVGTIREWKGKKYIKVAPNQWKPKYDSVNRGAKMSLGHLKKAVSNANSEEELYNIINTNASRFRDENGRPFPEVQELHDLVTKRQGELNPAENGNSGEEIGGESKGKENAKGKGKEKMSYADKIAAIQKMGKKAESAVQNTGSGHVDNAIENAANDVVDSTKNAAAKEEKKKVAAQKKTSEPGMSEEEKDKWLSQFEKDSSNSEKNDVKSEDMKDETYPDNISGKEDFENFLKRSKQDEDHISNLFDKLSKTNGNEEQEELKGDIIGNLYDYQRTIDGIGVDKNALSKMRELFDEAEKDEYNSDRNYLENAFDQLKKIKEQTRHEKLSDAIKRSRELDDMNRKIKESGKTVAEFLKDRKEEETFESLTEQYNATKDPDEREKLLNKIMALEETKKEKISEMKEENEKEQGYSEKTKEEIDNMNREEYHQYMSRSQKTIPLDKIGYGGGHVTDLDNAYKMCQKIAETYGDTPEGIDKLNTFLIYNTNTASRMYDELNEKLGIDYALLDADHNLAYKNAMKTLLGTKTKKDSEKEKNAVGKYEDRMSAALKKLL